MKAVWSLWTKPMRTDLPVMGWAGLRFHLMSWVLSLNTCRRFFDTTELITDARGAELLVDRLGLSFDHVKLDLDALQDERAERWAIGKLHAYRAQSEPFIHLDSDLYLWRDLPQRLRTAPVLSAYPERSGFGFQAQNVTSFKLEIERSGGRLPPELMAHRVSRLGFTSCNCCMVGGQRADFVSYYADLTIRMIEDPANAAALRRRQGNLDDMLLFEQHMFQACADYHRRQVSGPFAGITMAYLFRDEDDARDNAEASGFTHLIGGLKRDPAILQRLERRVRADYPQHYERCMALERA
jgi:hypothetical protein